MGILLKAHGNQLFEFIKLTDRSREVIWNSVSKTATYIEIRYEVECFKAKQVAGNM